MNPITIDNFKEGAADSPMEGFGLLRNVDIASFPGAAKVAKKPTAK